MSKYFFGLLVGVVISGCANTSALDIARGLFGYIEPPKAQTALEAMQEEYDRCMKIDSSRNCSQIAFDNVRISQGLEPKEIPKGYVVIVKETLEKDSRIKEESKKTPETDSQ